MFSTFVKSAFRNFKKDKFHLIINITGLALGMTAFLYIVAYISFELNFDRFHMKGDRIYRCVAFLKMGDVETNFAKSELPLAQVLMNDLPEVELATRIVQEKNQVVRQSTEKFVEDEIWYADANLFKVFDLNLIEGDKNTALTEPNSILITKKIAQKYYGKTNPVGKTLEIGDPKQIYIIKGILGKIPDNSHLQIEMLASFNSLAISKYVNHWGDFSKTYTYLLLKEGVDLSLFKEKYQTFPMKYWGTTMEKALGKPLEDWRKEGNYLKYELQPLAKIHLNTDFQEELKNQGNSLSLYIFGFTGLFILLIACFNFINLSTAKASLRAKEIGVKKIIGSSRKGIILQILTETFGYSFLAIILAVIILLLTIPVLNNISGSYLNTVSFFEKSTLLSLLLLPVVVTLFAGFYPAFYMTSFKPEEVLTSKFSAGKTKSIKRGGLVATQFVVFIVLIFSSVIIQKQLAFLHHQNPGFNKENVLVVKNAKQLNNNKSAFKNTVLQNPQVLSASYSSALPSADEIESNIFSEKGKNEQIILKRIWIDPDFQKTLNIEMADGRYFSNEINQEQQNAIINEEAARLFGWSNCRDKILYDYNNGGADFKIIGIVKNFHMKSLSEKAEPAIIRISDQANYLAIRVAAGQARNVLAGINSEWDIMNSETPFEYFFLDESFDAQYHKEEQLGKLISMFTVIAILIACLGLFGLVSYTSVQRQKEIGIRKVNGAKVIEILLMLNKDIIKWIVFAFVIACPIGYYTMQKWLENFAFKTNLSWWVFVLAGLTALLIAVATVSWQSLKAATQNPVKALKYE